MSDSFKLGEHERAIEQLALDMKDVKEGVRRIEIALAERRGERRAAQWAVGLVSSGGTLAFVGALWKFFSKH